MTSKVLDAFKLKPFDLEPVYESWKAPVFTGNSKKDPSVEAWMEQIKAGCIERKIPEECWHKVAQHYMGDLAKARLNEVKKVMAQVQGGKYRWTWKKYKVAMTSMSWKIDSRKMEPVKIHEKKFGGWWVTKTKEEPKEQNPPRSPVKQRSMSNLLSLNSNIARKEQPPVPVRSNTTLSGTISTVSNAITIKKLPPTPPLRSNTTISIKSPATKEAEDKTIDTTVITTEVPAWLLNACSALDLLTTEHPKVMTTLSAILITVGSIPAIPAIASGAGGAILASGAAHAVGAVAVGVGSWIKLQQETKQKTLAVTAAATEAPESK